MRKKLTIAHTAGWMLLLSVGLLSCGEWVLPDERDRRACAPLSGEIVSQPNQLTVQLNVNGITNADLDKVQVQWAFGDGSGQTTSGTATVAHTYAVTGTYPVSATLVNSCRQTKLLSKVLTVTNVLPPNVVTLEVTTLQYTTANVRMVVAGGGNSPITRYGICWSATNAEPTIADSTTDGTVPNLTVNSPQTINIPRLRANTLYHFRAFALNAGGVGYGAAFAGATGRLPQFVITAKPAPSFTTAQITMRVTDPGTPSVAQYGLTYSTTTDRPDPAQSRYVDLTNLPVGADVPVSLTGLQSGKPHWVRPFARTSVGVVFGPVETFSTVSTLIKDLVLDLPFDGRSLLDQSGLNNHATLVGSPGFTTDRRGNASAAVKLDGVNDYLFIPDNASIRPDTAFSISLWMRPDALDATMQIYNKARWADSGGEQFSSLIRPGASASGAITINTDIKQGSGCRSGVAWQTFPAIFDNEPLVGRWTHLVFTYRGRVARMYLNGELISQRPDLPDVSVDNCPGGELKFGAQIREFPQFFNGAFDDIRMYRRQLTSAEILELSQL